MFWTSTVTATWPLTRGLGSRVQEATLPLEETTSTSVENE